MNFDGARFALQVIAWTGAMGAVNVKIIGELSATLLALLRGLLSSMKTESPGFPLSPVVLRVNCV